MVKAGAVDGAADCYGAFVLGEFFYFFDSGVFLDYEEDYDEEGVEGEILRLGLLRFCYGYCIEKVMNYDYMKKKIKKIKK
jgi:hypothetical protein